MNAETKRVRLNNRVINAIDPRALPQHTVEQLGMNQFVSRNSKCPCGSGQRFKRCCGTEVV